MNDEISTNNQFEVYENPGKVLEIRMNLPVGGWLKVTGIDDQKQIVEVGAQVKDVVFEMRRSGWYKVPKSWSIIEDKLYEKEALDLDWVKQLALMLGRHAQIWMGDIGLYDLLDYACHTDMPLPNENDMVERDKAEIQIITSWIAAYDDHEFEHHVWDDEDHRQDGPADYNEWKSETDMYRH